jgi:UDP-glucose 4-epimerase
MSWTDRKVLVTGGAGFIGSNLCDALLAAGARVTVLDDMSVGRRANVSPGATLVEGSILDQPLVASLLADVEVVFHLAVACLRVCFDRPEHVHETNATGTLRVLEACRHSAPRLQRFVYCSSSEVYGSAQRVPMDEEHPLLPTTVYGGSKLAGELYTEAYRLTYGMPTTIVRPFNTYGPREHHEGASGEVIPRFAVRILNGLPPLIFGDGQQTRDFTYVADTAEGLMRAAVCPEALGATINIARGEEVSIADIASKLLQKLGRAELGVEHRFARPADVFRHYAAVHKAEQLLDFRPPTRIDEGLDRYLAWLDKAHPEIAGLLGQVQEQNW